MSQSKSNIEILRAVYADLSRIGEYCDNDVVLHTADRGASGGPSEVVGKQAVLDKELSLIALTGSTLRMEVQNIIANEHFGAVLGVLRANRDSHAIGMPFCGLWRFHNGRIVEHWENAYDVSALSNFLVGEVTSAGVWLDDAQLTGKMQEQVGQVA